MAAPPGRVTRRSFLQTAAGVALTSRFLSAQETSRTRLYNGITQIEPWPPRRSSLPPSPQRPPYLDAPPAVIDIDVGRQLFVDDFLIEESSLYRTFHRATYHPASPVLTPATAAERHDPYALATKTPPSSSAMVFSDGVFFDPADRLFKMWYMSGYQQHTAVAWSRDGITWERPNLDVVPGTNLVSTEPRDSSTVWLDVDTSRASDRYKMASFDLRSNRLRLQMSPDGVHWRRVGESGPTGDRSTCFWNPFRRRWVFSLRDDDRVTRRRVRRYVEAREFAGAQWSDGAPVLWTGADSHDLIRPEVSARPELYNVDAVAYESVLLGLFTIFRGERPEREKPNDLCLGFSRDGFHWDRTWRDPFITVSDQKGDWNWANVQSAGGCCLVVGDRLHFYVSGRQGVPGTSMPGVCSTGLATLRRDGFASVGDQAPRDRPRRVGSGRATLTTRPLKFSGRHLFVNADVDGELLVEVLDREGRPIAPFSSDGTMAVSGDRTKHAVRWRGAETLERVAGEVVRFRFTLSSARLYSFWVSGSARGQSGGYVAAGGPGYSGAMDAG